jgi:hypothetical protein
MRKPLVFLLQLFVISCFAFQSLYSKNRELILEFSSEKEIYSEQEKIEINYKVINRNKETVTFLDVCLFDCGFFPLLILTDDKGVRYKYHGVMTSCIGLPIRLKQGDTIASDNELLRAYGIENSGIFGFHYLKEGKYTLTLDPRYCNDIVLISNVLKFEIKKPSVQDGYDVLRSVLLIQDISKKSDSLKDFIYNYPQSAYMFIVFDEYLKLFPAFKQNKYEMTDVFKYFLSKRNSSWNVRKNVYDIAYVINWLKGEDTMINFLVYIIKQYPGSRAASTAYEVLKRTIPNDFYIKMLLN